MKFSLLNARTPGVLYNHSSLSIQALCHGSSSGNEILNPKCHWRSCYNKTGVNHRTDPIIVWEWLDVSLFHTPGNPLPCRCFVLTYSIKVGMKTLLFYKGMSALWSCSAEILVLPLKLPRLNWCAGGSMRDSEQAAEPFGRNIGLPAPPVMLLSVPELAWNTKKSDLPSHTDTINWMAAE